MAEKSAIIAEMDLGGRAEGLLKAALGGNATFREGQREAIASLLQPGARVLLVQATGWGKSVVYFLAARLLLESGRGCTLVISPLIALMRNQVELAHRFGLRAEALHSENREEWQRIAREAECGELDLLLISPERLHQPDFAQRLLPMILPRLGLVVIDEAHCISEWGHDFRPEYRTVLRQLQGLSKEASILGATATATERVVGDLRRIFGPFLEVRRGRLVRQSLRLAAIPLADAAERLAWLAKYLPRFPGSGIVYALTVFDAKEVARWLKRQGIEAEAYHAELDAPRRIELERAFSENRVKALVATTALGMGYDKADVGFVVHFQTPSSLVGYYQQVGRAGRAMDRAYAVLLAGEEDEEIVESFINSARAPKWVFEQVVKALSKRPLGFAELNHEAPVAPSMLRHTLDILDAADALALKDGLYGVRPAIALKEIEHGEAIREVRRLEMRQMLDYVKERRCRMQCVAEALGDASSEPCGICDACKPIGEVRLDPAKIAEAREFLDGEPKVLLPRIMLPTAVDLGRSKRLAEHEQNLPGIVLGVYGDSGWGKQVRDGKYGEGRFAEALVEAAAAALGERSFRPEWLTWIPSSRRDAPIADFAHRLAQRLGIPGSEAVRRIRPRPPQKTMTTAAEQFLNVWEAFVSEEVRPGPCLLLDDIVDSGWTLTVAGLRLREAGSGPVMPLALAASSTGRIRLREEVEA